MSVGDLISNAIRAGKHISCDSDVNEQTWEQFEVCAENKQVVLFGASPCAQCFFDKYGKSARVDIVVDNDIKKTKYPLGYFCYTKETVTDEMLNVAEADVLKKYNPNELIVLIASTNYYISIMEQLHEMNIDNCFSVLTMEANYRKGFQDQESESEKRKAFAEKCCNYEIEKKKIVFRSFGNYSDHQKYITEALLKLRKDLDIVWMVRKFDIAMPEGVRKVYEGNWKQYVYEMETAGMWILDLEVPPYLSKRENQIYIQTKHWASVTLKKFYLDAITFESVPERIQNWERESRIIDYIMVGSEFDIESCKRGFGFGGPFVMVGSPRTDGVFNEKENKEKVYNEYHIEKSVKALLYAPTYRFDKDLGKNYAIATKLDLDFELVKKALERRFGGEWHFVLRLHPSVANAWRKVEMPEYVHDASSYEDSEELVAACEIAISDFSSIMFEPAFAKKKVILLAKDLEDYLKNEYELLIDYRSLPFPIAETNKELEEIILQFDEEEYERCLDEFFDEYGVHEDGHASERAAKFVSDVIDGREHE